MNTTSNTEEHTMNTVDAIYNYRAEGRSGDVVASEGLTLDEALRQMSNLQSWGYRIIESTVPWYGNAR